MLPMPPSRGQAPASNEFYVPAGTSGATVGAYGALIPE